MSQVASFLIETPQTSIMASKYAPSPYKISTITATGSINHEIDLGLFYESVEISPDDCTEGIMYIEYGEKKQHTYFKGFHKKQTIARRKKTESKRFDNQTTVIIKLPSKINPNGQFVNMKVFRNGNVQMTGIKYISQGREAIEFLIKQVLELQEKLQRPIIPAFNPGEKLCVSDYRVRLINSDFRIGFEIKRDKLCKIMQQKCQVFCSYEPCIYPGVKIQYNYNTEYSFEHGKCNCTVDCTGKGCGSGNGACKKITIAAFQSGCVIITGAQTIDQIDKSYNFICNAVKQHADELYKPPCSELLKADSLQKQLARLAFD